MSNEMDLHTSTDTPNSGIDRVLVYYYAALALFAGLFVYPLDAGLWKIILVCALLVLALVPPMLGSAKKRKLRDKREAQLAEYRKSKGSVAEK